MQLIDDLSWLALDLSQDLRFAKACTNGTVTDGMIETICTIGRKIEKLKEVMSGLPMPGELDRFYALRTRLFEQIQKELAADGHCKSYEGAFELTVCWPDYFDGGDLPNYYVLTLHLYLIAPSGRHHEWRGKSITEVLDKAEHCINEWIKCSDLHLAEDESCEECWSNCPEADNYKLMSR